jgi:hypothetical protein
MNPRASRLLAVSALLLASQVPALAVGDGPRTYMLAPANSNILTAYGLFLDGNQALDPGVTSRNLDLEVDVGVLQYTRAFSICDHACGVFLIAPYGSTEGTFNFPRFPRLNRSGESSGLADIQLGAVFGLYGSPSLEVADYLKYDPGFSLGLLGKITAPTGEYDETKVINLGSNRWGLQVGVPMGYYLGDSFLDPNLTTFELLPSAFLFGDNDDPFRAGGTGQDPLYQIEAHITRNLGRMFWVSLDANYQFGGETTTDGVPGDDDKESFGLGATIGVNLSKQLSVNATYGEVISHNDNGADGHMFRVKLAYLF